MRPAGATTAPRLRELRPYLTRLVRWQPMAATAGLALLVGRLASVPPATKETTMAVLLALGTTGVLDDPAAPLVASSPSPLWWRRGVRVAVAVPLVAVLWWAVSAVATSPWPLTTRAAAVHLAALAAVGGAAAALALRHGERSGAVVAGPALLGFVVVTAAVPGRWAMLPAEAHEPRWALVAVVGLTLAAAASRDQARAGWRCDRRHSSAARRAWG